MPTLFCFGLGYSALALAERLQAEGWRIAGTARAPERRANLRARGIEAVAPEDAGPHLAGADHLLVSASPSEDGDPCLRLHGSELARRRDLAWIGYLSATGVYGDTGGAWVDETTPLAPTSAHGRRRVQAERDWLALWQEQELPVHVFRLAGIYGPGRNALETVLAGRAQRIVKPGQVFSRIHVTDIAATLAASIATPSPGRVYNVADDAPAPPAEVMDFACTLLGVEPPPEIPFETAELSPMARSFYADNKRVANRRIREELGVALAYPTYRDGLTALAAAIRRES